MGLQLVSKYKRLKILLKKGRYFDCISLVLANIVPAWIISLDKSYLVLLSHGHKIKISKRAKKYIFREANSDDLSAILTCAGREKDTKRLVTFSEKFKEGELCFLIEDEDQVVAYCFARNQYSIFFNGYKNTKIKLDFTQQTVVFWDGYIHPDYRLKGLFPVLMGNISTILYDKYGKTTFLAEIQALNEISVNSHLRLGFKNLHTYYYISLFGKSWLILTSAESKFQFIKIDKKAVITVN